MYSKGKWEIVDAGLGTITFIRSGDDCICQIGYCDLPEEEAHKLQLANARLIAAAPELLRACKFFCEMRNAGGGYEKFDKAQEKIEAAIATAEKVK